MSEYLKSKNIYTHDINDLVMLQDLLSLVIINAERFKKNIDQSNTGYQTNPFIHEKFLNLLTKYIEKNIHKDNKTFFLKSMYGCVNTKHAFNHINIYDNGYYSGLIWLKLGKKAGKLKLLEPTSNAIVINKKNSIIEISPKEGQLVLFPSNVPYLIEPNEDNVPQIFIKFNFKKNINDD